MEKLISEHPITGVNVKVCAVENSFFGPSVTVSGLITGNDLIKRIKKEKCDAVLITECMLRSEGDKFLDDVTLKDAINALGVKIIPVGRSGQDLLNALLDFSNAGREK